MGGFTGPQVVGKEDVEVYVDTHNQKRGLNAGVGLGKNKKTISKINQAAEGTYGGVKCTSLDGSNDSIDFSPAINISHNNPWTFGVWFYIGNSSTIHRRHLICKRGTSIKPGSISFYYNTSTDANGNQTNRVRFLVAEERTAGAVSQFSFYPGPYGSSYVLTSLQNAFWCNQWHYIVIRKGYSSVSRYDCFLNGEYNSGTTRSTGYVNNGLDADCFGGNGSYSSWYGGLGAPKVWSKALTDQQILNQYNRFKKRYGH